MTEIVANEKNIGTVLKTAEERVKGSFWGQKELVQK